MAGCIFCRIIKGEIPCAKVYEDDMVIGFLDANPISAGHTLVLPKRHYATLFEIPEEELLACASVSRKVAAAVREATKAPGLNLLQNNYRAAGQFIDHIHFHLIPCFEGDGLLRSSRAKPGPSELQKVAEKIKELLIPG